MRKKILLALALLCAAPPARADILIPGAPDITLASLLTTKSFLAGYPGQFLQPGNNGGISLTMDGTANYFALINTTNTNNTGGYSAGVGDFWDMFIVVYNAQQEVSAFGSNGSYQTAAYINANGHYGQNTPPYIYWILPSSDPSMYACYGDITGPCIQTRNSGSAPGTRNFDALDWQGKYSLSIDGNNHQLLMGRSSTYAAMDTFLAWPAAATFQFGGADAAAPVAQTMEVQNVLAGTSNTAGANLTIKGSAGTGNAKGGHILLQVTEAGASGTAQNGYTTFMDVDPASGVYFPNTNISLASGAQYSWSSGGGIYSATYGTFGFSGGGYTVGVTNTAAGAWSLGNGTSGDYSGSLKLAIVQPGKLYSAAGTALPTCNAALEGARATVSDATSPTYLGTYASGGAVVSGAFCNGSTWVTD
jgi:hypothetical protein